MPAAMAIFGGVADPALADVGRRRSGISCVDEIDRVVDQHAGRLAACVADDLAARRIGRRLGDAREPRAPSLLTQHRVTVDAAQRAPGDRRDRASSDGLGRELPAPASGSDPSRGRASHSPAAAPAAAAATTFAAASASRRQPANATIVLEIDAEAVEVAVRVDQAGRHRRAARARSRGVVGPIERAHLGVVADRDHAAPRDRDRASRARLRRIHRADVAADQDESTRSGARVRRGSGGVPQARSANALISKANRQIDLDVTGFETIPEIESQEGQHDLPKIEPRPDADRVLERREVLRVAARVGQVVARAVWSARRSGTSCTPSRGTPGRGPTGP